MSDIPIPWSPAPEGLSLSEAEVHVWRIELGLPGDLLAPLVESLSPEERQRAGRFHFQKDRDHFIAAHGSLRRILGGYLGIAPGQVSFQYSSYGKPALAPAKAAPQEAMDLRFNLSHSHGLALLAVTAGREIGVDVEQIRPDLAGEEIARRFFSKSEVETLLALPPELKPAAFFTCWTRKEAYIKALGEGLSMPLDRFDVSLDPGRPAVLLATRDDPQEASRWRLQELHPGRGFVAALAVEGRTWQHRCWQWSP